MPARMIRNFLRFESAGGIILIIAALLALILYNSPVAYLYEDLLSIKFSINLGNVGLSKSLLAWINDGMMALFFFLVGLELKREMVEGQLSHMSQAVLPIVAAIGGMVVPVWLYVMLNGDDPVASQGWAIPVATDIAFALGVLSLLGRRVPVGLKIFLTALAIIDDIGAIAIIAMFHTKDLSFMSLALSVLIMLLLIISNQLRLRFVSIYVILGFILWVCVLKSGVHATLAGVFLAFTIPMRTKRGDEVLSVMEKKMHPWVAYLVMPLFAFANAGIPFEGLHMSIVFEPIPWGIIIGLFIGKQIGVFLSTWIVVKLRLAKLPAYTNWLHIYGVSLLCGVGFTMSLFIGSLAFKEAGTQAMISVRVGVLLGSLLSGVLGYCVLRLCAINHRFAQFESHKI